MAEQDGPPAEPLGAGEVHERRRLDVDQRRAEVAAQHGGEGAGERQRRQEQVPEVPGEPLPVPGRREPAELEGEEDQEQDADPERGRGQRQGEQAADELVRPAVAMAGGDDGERCRDQDREHRAVGHQEQGDPGPAGEELEHRRPVAEGLPEVAGRQVPHVDRVLLDERAVQAPLPVQGADRLVARPVAEDRRRRVPGQELDEQEDKHRHEERHGQGLPHPPAGVPQEVHGARPPPAAAYSATVTFLKIQGPVASWTNPFIFLLMAMVYGE